MGAYWVYSLLKALPSAAELARTLGRVRAGDPEAVRALADFRRWQPLAEAFSPELARLLEGIEAARDAFAYTVSKPQAVEAEFYEPMPWSGFVSRLKAQKFGGHIIMGYMGSGKTTLALKLAWLWKEAHGYVVDAVEMDDRSRPEWARAIDTQTLLHRAHKLKAYRSATVNPDPDEERAAKPRPREVGPPVTERVILIDEAGLAIPQTPSDPVRWAIREALVYSRHVNWLVIFCAQAARLIPQDIFGLTTVWVKAPPVRSGDRVKEQLMKQADTDRDVPYIRELYDRAAEALSRVFVSNYFAGEYADLRAWAYVESPELGYTGVVPFRPWEIDATGGDGDGRPA